MTRLLDRQPAQLLLIAAVAIAARFATFGNPVIGFDEQFYLLVGDRMLHGALPYVDLFDRKPVGLFVIYAAARLLGGDGFLQYKLVALGFVVATAFAIRRLALPFASRFGATAAAIAYILWLDLVEGEGGQSPVFYALPMILAAGAVLRALRQPAHVRRLGTGAMLAVGLALQIKYSVIFEGVFFGLVLLAIAWRANPSWRATALCAVLWIAAALLPTLLCLAGFAALGHAREFVFSNFVSLFGQSREPGSVATAGLGVILLILGPLLIPLLLGRSWRHVPARERPAFGFVLGWLAVAALGVLLYWRFASPHYAMPILLPLTIAAAPLLDANRIARAASIALLALIFAGGQIALHLSGRWKGGAVEAAAIAAAARPRSGCIYVYDGYPALYMLTGSCLPSRWVFPGHLNTQEEARGIAIGVDPQREVARIMRGHPDAVVDDYPAFERGNRATHAIVQAALQRDYRRVACIATGPDRWRLVYRLRSDPSVVPQAGACPAFIADRSGAASPDRRR